ncbi:MAG: hypothetical protein OEU90_16050 [Gammaproteobacteria bacterium]|nr:hypothetical protein [Gammaproteobacteria bacterium]MDH3750369.1 hypothetical protein [Gammaproteobacteria bacterium]MDH3806966.1 hypothetical protein [Gammaproteobacteria bacterium]
MYRTVVIVIFGFLAASALADVNELPDLLFQDDETLPVTITAPFTTLVRERPKDDYLPGVLEYTGTDGTTVKFDLEVRTRGHFRHRTCEYPPLSLNLKKSQTDGTLFDKQNKLKLVIHCDFSERYEQVVLREYLAYRILNAVTNMSFRVRLLRVTYVNNEVTGGGQVRYGFLIEHKNRLAKRYDLKDLEIERTTVASIQADRLNLTSVFAFLIGNTDFSPIAGPPDDDCCHNYVLFGNDVDPVIAIPYDFDQSGFVDAPYASPNQRFRIRSVRQRLYRGRCVNNEHVPASLRRFRDRRDSIYALINEQEGLYPRVRENLVRYIDKFYDLIDDPKKVERKIIKKCV